MFDRKEYDRKHSADVYADYRKRKDALALNTFGGCCYVCGKTEDFEKFHLHHVYYHVTESAYPRHSKSMNIRLKRLKEAEVNSERFRLICPPCHRAVEFIKHSAKDRSAAKLLECCGANCGLQDAQSAAIHSRPAKSS